MVVVVVVIVVVVALLIVFAGWYRYIVNGAAML